MSATDKQRSNDYEQIARVTVQKLHSLVREGWTLPLAVEATGADDERLFACQYEGFGFFADDAECALPDVEFPVSASITAPGGKCCLLNSMRT
jgi:hypothetical protein